MLRFAMILVLAMPAPAGTRLDPPAKYGHVYTGDLTIIEVKRANVWAECSRNGEQDMRKDVAGCAFAGDGECTIYLATKTQRAPVKAILRHETAHCNGWAADHSH